MIPQLFSSTRALSTTLAAAYLLVLAPGDCDAQIYADFETSAGNFTIEFFHEGQPMAVANFVGLAEGSIAWLDFNTLKVRREIPYYNGIKFHRVIKDFMIQGGSPNGMGTDGPGYQFVDRFARNKAGDLIHPHDQQGLISMANSGINTNGSQFFITDVPTPWLDNKHIAFGKIAAGPFGTRAEGITVITAMNEVPTTGSVPDEDLVILSITIRRVGAEALAFDVHAQGLPILSEPQGELDVDPSGAGIAELLYDKKGNTQVDVHRSGDLQNWELLNSNWFSADQTGGDDISGILTSEPIQFFRFNKIDYTPQGYLGGPESLANSTLELRFNDSPVDDMDIMFDAKGSGGTWSLADGSASGALGFASYSTDEFPLIEKLRISLVGYVTTFELELYPELSFDGFESKRFAGGTNANVGGQPLSIDGTFELIP